MLTNKKIEELITCSKIIIDATPKQGMAADNKTALIKRKNLNLTSQDEKHQFTVFIRQNTMLVEQFSIGLLYHLNKFNIKNITLIRFNGEHGQQDWSKDNHYNSFHIHSINEVLLKQRIFEPKEITITNKYNTFHSALFEFIDHVNIVNYVDFFPNFKKC